MDPVGLILVAAGLFSVCGAAFDWDFFMNSSKAWLFVKLFGREWSSGFVRSDWHWLCGLRSPYYLGCRRTSQLNGDTFAEPIDSE